MTPWFWSLLSHKAGVATWICNPSTWEVKASGPDRGVQDHGHLQGGLSQLKRVEEGSWFGKAEGEVGPASVFISRDLGCKETRVDRY